MKGAVRRMAHAVRQAPGLRNARWLWRIGRGPYYRFLSAGSKGVAVTVGGPCTLPMPAEFCGGNWEAYEVTAVARMASWLKATPNALVLDVGCEAGFYSLLALTAGTGTSVIGFDPDRANLKKTEQMCRYAQGDRLTLVHGFLSERHESGSTLETAARTTSEMLHGNAWREDEGRSTYMGLDVDEGKPIPTHSLDGLLKASMSRVRPILLKCDVEGAELLVLRGAAAIAREARPTMLISVHPDFLPKFGHSVNDVREFLEKLGYVIDLLGVDHEEHWWCEPREPRGNA